MKILQIGIMPRDDFQNYVMQIASGQYKPRKNEPKIWFNSIKSLSEILNKQNMRLLKIIKEYEPQSIKELALLAHRKPSNLSRTLNTMARYNIISLEKIGKNSRPVVKALDFNIQYRAVG